MNMYLSKTLRALRLLDRCYTHFFFCDISFSFFQSRYVKKFKLADVVFEDIFSGPLPTYVKSKPKVVKPKQKSNVVDLTGEDEFIKQKKRERKEKKQALKKKKKGTLSVQCTVNFLCLVAERNNGHCVFCDTRSVQNCPPARTWNAKLFPR